MADTADRQLLDRAGEKPTFRAASRYRQLRASIATFEPIGLDPESRHPFISHLTTRRAVPNGNRWWKSVGQILGAA
jgi:hypothetical protein